MPFLPTPPVSQVPAAAGDWFSLPYGDGNHFVVERQYGDGLIAGYRRQELRCRRLERRHVRFYAGADVDRDHELKGTS